MLVSVVKSVPQTGINQVNFWKLFKEKISNLTIISMTATINFPFKE